MLKKVIEIDHSFCDYNCMWRGIEDMYQTKTKEKVPSFLFFSLSGRGEFTYQKKNQEQVKRLVTWDERIIKKMYKNISDIVGFTYKHMENTKFEYMLKVAKEQIDLGKPVILGPVDMFYLPYFPKIFCNVHIPIHFIMMVGYDDEQQCAYIVDGGIDNMVTLDYEHLEKAIANKVPPLAGKNGLYTIDFNDNLPSLREITQKGFERKCNKILHSQVGYYGIRGMHKLATEIDTWKDTFSINDYQCILRSFVTYTGTAPSVPERIYGAAKDSMSHSGFRDTYAGVLRELDQQFQVPEWTNAAQLFLESSIYIQQITDAMVEYLIGNAKEVGPMAPWIDKIATLEEKANQCILDGIH